MKAIVFDFDGTLTKSKEGNGCWAKIWSEIDDVETDNLYYGMRKRNEIDDSEWMDLILKRFAFKGVNHQTCKNIAEKIQIQNKLGETFEAINRKGIKIFILSGGIKPIIVKTLKDNLQYVESIESYDFEFDYKGIVKRFISPTHNLECKEEFLNLIKEKYNFNSKEILFVGNGKNDETTYKSGVKTLCINPGNTDFKNKLFWNFYIEKCNSLDEILQFIE